MSRLWHPLSSVLFEEPRCFVTTSLLNMLLRPEEPLGLLYAGDRMWPTLRSGQRVEVVAPDRGELAVGAIVLVRIDGIPDLYRVTRIGSEQLEVAADADPDDRRRVGTEDLLAVAHHSLGSAAQPRACRRLWLEIVEAVREAPDPAADAARTVQQKYDFQSSYYVETPGQAVAPALRESMLRELPPPGRLLVVGSGVGRECFELEQHGWEITGLDFAGEMVGLARKAAAERDSAVRFEQGDLREHQREPATLDGIFFTFDVYSFLPGREIRIECLARMRRWLRPGAAIFLSARVTRSPGAKALLWLTKLFHPAREWGASHTRWIAGDGRMRRSFIQVLTERGLRAEFRCAGYDLGPVVGSHRVLRPGVSA